MIQRTLQFLTLEVRGMHAAAYVLALSAFFSAVLALLRDRLLAHTFGAGPELDVYYAAFRIPDLVFVLVASLFSAYVLIPELSKREAQEARKTYIDTVMIGYSALIVCVSLAAYALSPFLLEKFFGALYRGPHGETLLTLARLLLLQPVLLGFSNILAAITQYGGRYTLYAFSPILYNLGIIMGVGVFYPYAGMVGIGWGVVFGALLHAGILYPSAVHAGFLRGLPTWEGVRVLWGTVSTSLPRTFALAGSQMLIVGLLALAAPLAAGSVAVFSFALNLQAVPLAIIGASYSVAAFPMLAKMLARGDTSAFVEQVVSAARHILFWSLPAVAFLVVLRAHIVRAVLGSGAFDWTDTRLTAAILAVLSFALVAQALTLLLLRSFYAAGKSYTPLIISFSSAGAALVLAYGFLGAFRDRFVVTFMEDLLRVADVPGVEVVALALAYAVAAFLTLGLLIAVFEHSFGGFLRGTSRTFWEAATASGVSGGAAYALLTVLGGISSATTFSAVLTHGALAGAVGLCVAALVYALLGSRELAEAYQTIVRRTRPRTPVGSAEEQIS